MYVFLIFVKIYDIKDKKRAYKKKQAIYSLEKKPEKKRPDYVNILFDDGLCCSALCSA